MSLTTAGQAWDGILGLAALPMSFSAWSRFAATLASARCAADALLGGQQGGGPPPPNTNTQIWGARILPGSALMCVWHQEDLKSKLLKVFFKEFVFQEVVSSLFLFYLFFYSRCVCS